MARRTPVLAQDEAPRHRFGARAEQLLVALEALILGGGFARLTITAMVGTLHCSRRAIYELAASKNELITLILERFFAELRHRAEHEIASLSDPRERIFRYLMVGVAAAERLSPAVVSDIDGWPPSRQIWQEHIRLRTEGLMQLVEEGIASGRFRPVHSRLVADMVYGTLLRMREPDFYANTDMTPTVAFREFYGLLMAALVVDREATYFEQFESARRVSG